MFNDYPDVMTAEEACELLRVGHNTVYHLLNTGKLKGMRFGRIWKISKQSIVEFVAENSMLHSCSKK